MFISAGIDRNLAMPINRFESRVDNFAGGPIPISDLETVALYQAENTIHIKTGATIESYANIDLNADGWGDVGVKGVAKATNWTSAIGNALGGGSVGSGDGKARAVLFADIINDGRIVTGATRNKVLRLAVDNAFNIYEDTVTRTELGQISTGDVPFTVRRAALESPQFNEIADAKAKLADYADSSNGTLKTFLRDKITRLENELLLLGLAERQGGSIVPTQTETDTVRIGPVSAQAGRVRVLSDTLYGTGEFDIPRDTSIEIESDTHAQVEINGITIPEFNGGLYFNGTDLTAIEVTDGVSVVASPTTEQRIAAALAKITTENQANVDDNNRNGSELGRTESAKPAPGLRFTDRSMAAAEGMPTVTVQVSDINGFYTPNFNPPAQNIDIIGDIIARTARVVILNPSNGGSITTSAEVVAAELVMNAKTSVSISGVQEQHVGGIPVGQLLNSGLIGSDGTRGTSSGGWNSLVNSIDNDVSDADLQSVDLETLLASNAPSYIYAGRVTIDAAYINVAGLIQAGKRDYSVTLGSAERDSILRALRSRSNTSAIELSNNDFKAYFDRNSSTLVIRELRPTGGTVDLTGNIVNTGQGRIVANAAFPEISILNQTGLDYINIAVETLDASRRGDGIIKIEDTQRNLLTIYTKSADGTVHVESEQLSTGNSVGVGASDRYDPLSGMRYGFAIGQATIVRERARWKESGWLGVIDLGSSKIPVPPTRTALDAELIEGSNYFYRDVSDSSVYRFTTDAANPVQTSATDWTQTYYNRKRTWWGKTTYTYEYQRVVGEYATYSHSVEADRPIEIDFLHNQAGLIHIDGGGSNVLIDGQLMNPEGVTRIETTGDIRARSSVLSVSGGEASGTPTSTVGGRRIELVAGGRVGTEDTALPIALSQRDAARLYGQAGIGFNVIQTSGEVLIDSVQTTGAASGRGRVEIAAKGGIFGGSNSSLVRGGQIVLDAGAGGVGSSDTPLRIDTGTGRDHGLTLKAGDGVYLVEIDDGLASYADDLSVNLIDVPNALVSIVVEAGNLLDGNGNETVDDRAVNELLGSVWTDMALTAETGANDKVDDAKDSLREAKTREYRTYWSWRETQGEDFATFLAGDADYQFAPEEEQALFDRYVAEGDSEAEALLKLETLRLARANQLKSLHQDFGDAAYATVAGSASARSFVTIVWNETPRTVQANRDGEWSVAFTRTEVGSAAVATSVTGGSVGTTALDAYNPNHIVGLTQSEIEGIEASIKIWTPDELIYGFGVGLLQPVTDTQTANEDPNIIAGSLVLDVHGSIGFTEGQELIDLAKTLTSEQRILLAAAERRDISFLTTDRLSVKVNFDQASNSLTKAVAGGTDWGDIFRAGDKLQIEGTTENATDGTLYTVGSVTADSITFTDGGARKVGTTEFLQDIHVAAISLNPLGDEVDALVDVNASVGTITRKDGGDFGATFSVGDTIIVANVSPAAAGFTEAARRPSGNVNTADTAYTITAISGDTITLSGALNDEADIALNLRAPEDITWVQVRLQDDFNVTVTGAIKTLAGGDTFLGSEQDLGLVRLDAGEAVRVKTSGNIMSLRGDNSETILATDSLILESGTGAIGSDVQRLWYDLSSPDADVTARAAQAIWIGETAGDMRVATIYSRSGVVDLRALSGDMIDAINAAYVNIEAADIRLWAAGNIGSVSNPFDIEARDNANGVVTLFAGQDITVIEANGDMAIRQVNAGGDVTLTAALSILDAVDLVNPTDFYSGSDPDSSVSLPATDISGNNITLTALLGFIGQAGNELDIDMSVSAPSVLRTSSFNNTYLTETNGDIRLDLVSARPPIAQLSDIALTDALADGDLLTLTVNGAELSLIVAAGEPPETLAARLVAAITASDLLGNIVRAQAIGRTVSLEALKPGVSFAAALAINGTAPGTKATLNQSKAAEEGRTAFITAIDGSILNAAPDGQPNIIGGGAFLVAQKDIGAADTPILSQISRVQGESTTGDTYLTNLGLLEVTSITGGDVGMKADDRIDVVASSPIVFTKNVEAGGDISYRATETRPEDYDTITVSSGVSITSTGGSITFEAGDDFVVEANASVTAKSDLRIITDFDDGDLQGGDVTIAGAIEAQDGAVWIQTSTLQADTLVISGAVTGGTDVIIQTGAGNDSVTVSGDIRSGSGDIVLDTGTDADDLDSLTISGSGLLDAARDVLVFKLPQANYIAPTAGTVTLQAGDVVRVEQVRTEDGDDSEVGRAVRFVAWQGDPGKQVDLSSANFDDATLWAAVTDFPEASGALSLVMADTSSILADRDILIWTGSGDDRLEGALNLTAQRDLTIKLGSGTDIVSGTKQLAAITGTITIDMADGAGSGLPTLMAPQQITLTGGGLAAGTDVLFSTSGPAPVVVVSDAPIVAGRDILLVSAEGDDSFTFRNDLTAARNVTLLTASGSDLVTLDADMTAVSGTIEFDFGDDRDMIDRLVADGAMTAGTDILFHKLPQVDAVIASEEGEIVLSEGDIVRVALSGRTEFYRFLGRDGTTVDLSRLSLTNTRLWSEDVVYRDNTGRLEITSTTSSPIRANRDIEIRSGGGDDTIALNGAVAAGRDVTMLLQGGLDLVSSTAQLSATDGTIYIDLSEGIVPEDLERGQRAAQSLTVERAGLSAGNDVVILASGLAPVTIQVEEELSAGRDIVIRTGDGADNMGFGAEMTAGRSIFLTGNGGSDQIDFATDLTATTSDITVRLGNGDATREQRFEIQRGDMTAGGAISLTSTGNTDTRVVLDGLISAGGLLNLATGAGDDSFTLTGTVTAGGAVSIAMGAGADQITIVGDIESTNASVTIDLGTGPMLSDIERILGRTPGRDLLTLNGGIEAATFVRLAQSGTNGATLDVGGPIAAGTDITILTGGGDDLLRLRNTLAAGGTIQISTGDGRDEVRLDKAVRAETGAVRFDLGAAGTGVSQLNLHETIRAGTDFIVTASGAGDVVVRIVKAVTAGGAVRIATGAGDDEIVIDATVRSGSTASVETGAGADRIAIAATGLIESTRSDVIIDLGAADAVLDTIELAGALVATRALTIRNTGAGSSRIAMTAGRLVAGGQGITITLGTGADGLVFDQAEIRSGGNITIATDAGDDTVSLRDAIIAAAGQLTLETGAGADSVELLRSNVQAVGSLIALGEGADLLLIRDLLRLDGASTVMGGAGNDRLIFERMPDQGAGDSLLVDGGQDSDEVTVQTHGSQGVVPGAVDYRIELRDTGMSGKDRLLFLGTDQNDVVLSRMGSIALLHGTADALEEGASAASAERVLFDANQNEGVVILTYAGDDVLRFDDTTTVTAVDAGAGNDDIVIGQFYASRPAFGSGDAFGASEPTGIETTAVAGRWLSNGVGHATLIHGGSGADRIEVNANSAKLRIEGGAGDDTALLRSFRLPDGLRINAEVQIVGGTGLDRVLVEGSEGSDVFRVDATRITGAGRSIRLSGTEEQIALDARGGDDTMAINAVASGVLLDLFGGLGSDTMVVAGGVPAGVIGAGGAASATGSFGASTAQADPVSLTERDILGWFAANTRTDRVGVTALSAVAQNATDGARVLSAIKGLVRVHGGAGLFDPLHAVIVDAGDAPGGAGMARVTTADTQGLDSLTLHADAASNALSGQIDLDGPYQRISGIGLVSETVVAGGLSLQGGLRTSGLELTEILLGAGNDRFEVNRLAQLSDGQGAVTVVHGGSGNDTLLAGTVDVGTGLVLFGDTEVGGKFYAELQALEVAAGTLFGGPRTDQQLGDDLIALTGNGGGTVFADGGGGADTLRAGAMGAVLLGGAGNDLIEGGAGDDLLIGDGHLRIDRATLLVRTDAGASAGSDTLRGGAGDDRLWGDHAISSGAVPAWHAGAAQRLSLTSGSGGGADVLDAGDGRDLLVGGGGSDQLLAETGNGADILIGDGAQILRDAAGTVTAILSVTMVAGGADTLRAGTAGAMIIGGEGGDDIRVAGGSAIIAGDHARFDFMLGAISEVSSLDLAASGADTIQTGAGDDLVIGGGGDDRILTSGGTNILAGDHIKVTGLSGRVTLPVEGGVVQVLSLYGGAALGGADLIEGGTGRDLVIGGQGDDTLLGGAGDDDLIGDHMLRVDADLTDFDSGSDIIDAGAGDDVVLGDTGHIALSVTGLSVLVTTGQSTTRSPTDVLARAVSYNGATTIGGADYILGGTGDDILLGGAGADVILGDSSLQRSASNVLDTDTSRRAAVWTGAAVFDLLSGPAGQNLTGYRDTTGQDARILMVQNDGALYFHGTALPGGTDLFAFRAVVQRGTEDGDDYMEGGAGDDLLIGQGGSDDIIGGSSVLLGGAALASAGSDVLFGGTGRLDDSATSEGNVLVSGNASIQRIVASGAYLFEPSADTADRVIARAIELANAAGGATPSRLVAAGASDLLIKSLVADITYGDATLTQRSTQNGGSRVTLPANAQAAMLVGVIDRAAPQVAMRDFSGQSGLALTVENPVAERRAASTPVYAYDAVSGGFRETTPFNRPVSEQAEKVIDIRTVDDKGFAYLDDRGGLWLMGTPTARAGETGTGGGSDSGSGGEIGGVSGGDADQPNEPQASVATDGLAGESGIVFGAESGKAIRVDFGKALPDAVIVLTGMGQDREPHTLRVIARDATGFTFLVQHWDYLAGDRLDPVDVHWLALRKGIHQLEDGRIVEAGIVDLNHTGGTVEFTAGFSATPIMLTTVQSRNDVSAVDADPFDITTQGAKIRLREEKAADGLHATETVAYVAISPGSGSSRQTLGSTTRSFSLGGIRDAVVLAERQTINDPDTAIVNIERITSSTVSLKLAEDRSKGTNTSHTNETLGLAIFGRGEILGVMRQPVERSGASPSGTASSGSTGTVFFRSSTSLFGGSLFGRIATPVPEPTPEPVQAPETETTPAPVDAPEPKVQQSSGTTVTTFFRSGTSLFGGSLFGRIATPVPEPTPEPVPAPEPETTPAPVDAPEPKVQQSSGTTVTTFFRSSTSLFGGSLFGRTATPVPEPAPEPTPTPEPTPVPASETEPVLAPEATPTIKSSFSVFSFSRTSVFGGLFRR